MVRPRPRMEARTTPIVIRHKKGQEVGLRSKECDISMYADMISRAKPIGISDKSLRTMSLSCSSRTVLCSVYSSLACIPTRFDKARLLAIILLRAAEWLVLADACM